MGSAARKLRRAGGKKSQQLKQKTNELSNALSALSNMEGLQQAVGSIEHIGKYVQQMEGALVETRQLVDALVEDYQAMADERDLERKALCRVLARMNKGRTNYDNPAYIEELLDAEIKALQSENT